MHEIASIPIGTLPQWGSFIAMLTILAGCITVWIRGIPDRLRARADSHTAAAKRWEELEASVANDLHECREESRSCIKRVAVVEEENFRLRIAVSMLLAEIEHLDPGSDIIRRAQAVMMVAAGSAGAKP